MKLTTKPQCILHIGMPKTGSSSLQDSLYSVDANDEFEYPRFDKYSNHGPFIFSIFSENTLFYSHISEQKTTGEIDGIRQSGIDRFTKTLLETKSKKIILSSEDFIYLSENALLKLKKSLLEYVSNIQVLAYIRSPISFTQSAFQQNVKMGYLSIDLANTRYKEWFKKFDDIFGSDNVSFIKYDRETLLNGDVIKDFCFRMDISIEPKNHFNTNEGLSLEAIAFLYVFQKYSNKVKITPDEFIKKMALVEELSMLGTRKFKFSKKLIKIILKNNTSDIKWMESRMGVSLTEKIADEAGGITTEDDLIAIAMENLGELSTLLSKKIQQQLTTPQAVAACIAQLNQPLLTNQVVALNPNRELDIKYSIDMLQEGYIMGLIYDKNNPQKIIHIEISQAEHVIATGIANQFRQDLANAVISDGHCAFRLKTAWEPTIDGGAITIKVIEVENKFEVQPDTIKGLAA